ncbi:hypothetical protein [Microbacterium sp. BLY]|uniref:hypothetical protein n=1 Tax=Microbacterium sp. BLY TaxID=2823280 RepID=UPI001B327CBB|nr:hypothetical protein [Microbacterium sp. BLY]MBP3977848.1 hypothetical protein [Microbacterium sp. BLY]
MSETKSALGAVGAAAEGGNQKPAQDSVAPIISNDDTDRSRWIPIHLLRLEIGPLMRDSLVRRIADLEHQLSGRTMLDAASMRDGSMAAIVHPELADAVRAWYRDQALLLSNYAPSVASFRDQTTGGSRSEADEQWFSEHSDVLASRPPWASAAEVADFDGLEGVEVYFERQMGPISLTRYATYTDGALTWDDGTKAPYVSIDTRYREGLEPDDMLDLVGALLAAVPMYQAAVLRGADA